MKTKQVLTWLTIVAAMACLVLVLQIIEVFEIDIEILT